MLWVSSSVNNIVRRWSVEAEDSPAQCYIMVRVDDKHNPAHTMHACRQSGWQRLRLRHADAKLNQMLAEPPRSCRRHAAYKKQKQRQKYALSNRR